jgi:polysaccharide biosynthesis protein PslH
LGNSFALLEVKLLFLTSRLPFPPYRGDKLKIFNLIKYLSARHEVHLLSFIQHKAEAAFAGDLLGWCTSVDFVYLPAWQSLINCGLRIGGPEPFQVAYFRSSMMKRSLAKKIAAIHPDVIHTHLIRMAPYTMDVEETPRILDLTDAVSLYLDRYRSATSSRIRRWVLGIEHSRMLRFEKAISRFDQALVCSSVDREVLLENIPSARVNLLYNGIDLDTFTDDGSVAQYPNRIIFTGNMSYFPNADGAQFLVHDIFPHVKRQCPDAELYLVGQSPPRKVLALEREDVHVTGFVKDIRTEYLKSAVAVSPIRFGAGTLNKVLEPLAMGIPVVSTSIGIQGLDLNVGTDILVSDQPEQFADNIVALLRAHHLQNRIYSATREKIRAKFSWMEIGRNLESYYEQVSVARDKGRPIASMKQS